MSDTGDYEMTDFIYSSLIWFIYIYCFAAGVVVLFIMIAISPLVLFLMGVKMLIDEFMLIMKDSFVN